MATIANIVQGMTQAQVFEILNELIDAYNASEGAVSDSLTDGRIDYNKLVNRPQINGVTLEDNLLQAELEIDMDAATIQRLVDMESRVAGTETAEIQNEGRIGTLEGFKTEYKGYVDTLRTNRQTDRADIDTLQSQRTTDSGRIDLLDERYSAVHTTQTSEQAKVTTLQSQMGTKAAQSDFSQVVQRLIAAVNRLNIVADAVVLLENNGCTYGRKTMHDATSGVCISNIPNTFDFDD